MLTLIKSDNRSPHRSTFLIQYVDLDTTLLYDGIDRVVVQLEMDKKWWIIPDDPYYDDVCEDMGPYDTPEEAVVMLRLSFIIS